MSNIVDLDSLRPHNSGPCRCLQCEYEWAGTVPIGVVALECPKCHTYKGVLGGLVMPDESMCCPKCGNHLFFVLCDSELCSCCGWTHYAH